MSVVGGSASNYCNHDEKEVKRYDIKNLCNKKLFLKTVSKCINCKRTFTKLIEIKE